MSTVTEYSLADDLSLALALAAEADLISIDRYEAIDLVVTTKPDRTPVTDADQAVERLLRERIEAARPHDSILGEEYGGDREPGRQWILDPIDGTANFLRGVPIWGTLIALAIDGVPQVGVVSSPALGHRWWAAKGHGAFTAPTRHEDTGAAARRLKVSAVEDLVGASLSYNSLPAWDEVGKLDEIVGLTRNVWRSRAYGDMWSYMLLAEGALDIVGEFDLKPYDMAALIPIIEEAGGRFTSVDGVDGPWEGSALATNGILHDTVLSRLNANPHK
jgi:histidinol-phosphatase